MISQKRLEELRGIGNSMTRDMVPLSRTEIAELVVGYQLFLALVGDSETPVPQGGDKKFVGNTFKLKLGERWEEP